MTHLPGRCRQRARARFSSRPAQDVDLGSDGARGRRHELRLGSGRNVVLPDPCFGRRFPSTDIRRNTDTGRCFVPANVAMGRVSSASLVVSAAFGVPLLRDDLVHDCKAELRSGGVS